MDSETTDTVMLADFPVIEYHREGKYVITIHKEFDTDFYDSFPLMIYWKPVRDSKGLVHYARRAKDAQALYGVKNQTLCPLLFSWGFHEVHWTSYTIPCYCELKKQLLALESKYDSFCLQETNLLELEDEISTMELAMFFHTQRRLYYESHLDKWKRAMSDMASFAWAMCAFEVLNDISDWNLIEDHNVFFSVEKQKEHKQIAFKEEIARQRVKEVYVLLLETVESNEHLHGGPFEYCGKLPTEFTAG